MRHRFAHLVSAVVFACSVLGGCDGDDSGDVEHGRLEVLVDANVGDGRDALDATLGARQLVVTPGGDVLLAGLTSVRRVEARTGRITSVPGTELTECADGSSVETPCGAEVVAVAVDAHDRIYFALRDDRIMRVGPHGGTPEHVAGRSAGDCPAETPISGAADDVCFGAIADLAFDRAGNLLIADVEGARVLRFDPAARTVSFFAGNGRAEAECADEVPATATCIGNPTGIAVAPDGAVLVASPGWAVRRVDPVTGLVGRVAGRSGWCAIDEPGDDGGPALDACLPSIVDVAVDRDGDVYLADAGARAIRRVAASTEAITRFDGGGVDDPTPAAVTVDEDGRLFALVDTRGFGGRWLRRFGSGQGSGRTIAGTGSFGFCGDGGPAHAACLGYVTDVAVGSDDAIYVADVSSRRVRRIAHGTITTIAGNGEVVRSGERCTDGDALATCLESPGGVAVDRAGVVYVLEGWGDAFGFNRIRRVGRAGDVTTVVGGCRVEGDPTTVPARDACVHVAAIAIAPDGKLWVAENTRISRLDERRGRLVPVAAAPADCEPFFDVPERPECFIVRAVTVDERGDAFVADGLRVRRVTTADPAIAIVAGNGTRGVCGDGGPATDACLVAARVVADAAGGLLVAGSGVVRRVDLATGIVTHVAGDPSAACGRGLDDLVRPDADCASVYALDDRGRLLFPQLARFAIGRLVRLTP